MDLAFLRDHPHVIPEMVRHQRIRVAEIDRDAYTQAHRQLWTLDDGTSLFAKLQQNPPPGLFAAEAQGLRWLADREGPRLPTVIAVLEDMLVLEWVPPGKPTRRGARQFGRQLALMHRSSSAEQFGAPTGSDPSRRGYVGQLPLDNSPHEDWAEFFVTRRCLPYLRRAADSGTFDSAQVAELERGLNQIGTWGTDEPPAPIHGDLWAGNVHYDSQGSAWLVDAGAAHYGHRETDLATLQLFGAPFSEDLFAGYGEEYPLAAGWRERVPAHQLHLLLVHVVLFGGDYAAQALRAAQALG
ncbi:MAG TPA: fructosamine kinase family protein [Mycobacteriales bacterium]|jgi:fructosamine-3-kinase|nr:fructosamine kinase family protein [Mycobacteriales bacterium]